MRTILALTVAVAGAALAGPAAFGAGQGGIPTADERVAMHWIEGKQPGQPVSCIIQRNIRSTKYLGNHTILYMMNNGIVYRNDPPGGCPGLSSSAALVTRTPTGQLCSGDIAQVRDYGLNYSGGSCALAQFVPYR